LAGGLDLGDVFEGILWDHKKRPGVEIDVKKINGLFEAAEIFPGPELAAFFCFQEDAAVFEAEGKSVLESGGAFIDAEGKEPADGDPEKEPEDGKNKEGESLDLFEIEQDGRKDRKDVDDDDQGPDLGSGKKMAS